MRYKFKRNSVVEVTFWDHVQGAESPIQCVVFGRVHRCTKAAICVKVWDYKSPTPTLDHNIEIFAILQSTITNAKQHA